MNVKVYRGMRYLGIDFGEGRLGFALADERGIAVPLGIRKNDQSLWQYIQTVVADEGVGAIVVGWPISMNGQENARTERTARFMEELEERVAVPLYREDERLSTAAAKKRGVKGHDDAVAAVEILQTYLDRHAIPSPAV